MNPAVASIITGVVTALVPIVVLLITRFSDRKDQRARIANADAARDKTFQEIASVAANQAEAQRVAMVEIRKILRGLRDIFEDICLPILIENRPDLVQQAEADLARLDELL